MPELAAFLITGGPTYLLKAKDVDGTPGSTFIDLKLNQQEQLAEVKARQTSAREFASAEEVLRHDAGQTAVPPAIAERLARSFPDPSAGLNARTYGPPGLEEDIAFCAREDVLDVVPRVVGMHGTAAEISL